MRQVAEDIWAVTAGDFPANSFICLTGASGEGFLVDSGLDPEPIDAALRALDCQPAHVFCTHGHFDHIGSALFFQQRYGSEVHLHSADVSIARANNFVLMAMKREARITLPSLSLVEDGASFTFGERSLTFLSTPGHTPGSCSLIWGAHLFTGDTLFARGVGLSKLPGEDVARLRSTIRSLWTLLDDVTVHPGHGPSAPGSAVKRDNAALRAFLAEEINDLEKSSDV